MKNTPTVLVAPEPPATPKPVEPIILIALAEEEEKKK